MAHRLYSKLLLKISKQSPKEKLYLYPRSWQHRALQPHSPLGPGLPVSSYWYPASLLIARIVEQGLWWLTPRFSFENESFHQLKKLISCKSVFCTKMCFGPNLQDDSQTQITKVHSAFREGCCAHAFRNNTDWFYQSYLQPARTDRQSFSKLLRRPHSSSQLCFCSQPSELTA